MNRVTLLCATLAMIVLASIAADRPANAPARGGSVADLQKARIDTAADALRFAKQRYKAALTDHTETSTWFRRWSDARLEAAQNKDQRLAILGECVTEAKGEEQLVQQMFDAGIAKNRELDVAAAKFFRLGAELRLAKAQAE